MNAPFMQEQARRLADDCMITAVDDTDWLRFLYQRVLTREPTTDEQELALQFLANAETTETEKLSPRHRLAQVLLMSNEFTFVD